LRANSKINNLKVKEALKMPTHSKFTAYAGVFLPKHNVRNHAFIYKNSSLSGMRKFLISPSAAAAADTQLGSSVSGFLC
jgi:hypothetical protein